MDDVDSISLGINNSFDFDVLKKYLDNHHALLHPHNSLHYIFVCYPYPADA